MKKIIISFLCALTCLVNVNAKESLEDRLSALEEEITEIKINNARNRFNFSGTFENRYEHLKFEDSPNDLDPDRSKILKMSLKLNMNAKATSRTRFYSTLGMQKYYNVFTKQNTDDGDDQLRDFLGSRADNAGPAVFIDRAYLEYDFKFAPLTFSMGRFPTNSGPPQHLKDGLPEQGTYPQMTYNLILDGVALTYNFSKYLPRKHKLKVKVLYTPLGKIDYATPYKSVTYKNKLGETQVADKTYDKMLGAILDYEWKSIKFAKKLKALYHYYSYENSFPPIAIFNGSTLTSTATDLRNDRRSHNITLILERVKKITTDFFISYTKTINKLDGDYYPTTFPVTVASGYENGKQKGYSWLTGFTHHLPWLTKYDPILGMEYHYSNDTYASIGGHFIESDNIYSNNGIAYHMFGSFLIDQGLRLRIGHYVRNKHSGIGTSLNAFDSYDDRYTTSYANLRYDF